VQFCVCTGILLVSDSKCQATLAKYQQESVDAREWCVQTLIDVDMATKKPKVMIYLSEEQKEELDKWAKSEKRSVSNLVGFLVDQALENRKKKSTETSN
jgi:hypothetical protein